MPVLLVQILAQEQLLGRYGLLLSKMVHLKAFITYPQELQASALLALTQLMAVDGTYCSDNVAVLFTLLHKRWVLQCCTAQCSASQCAH
jgi:hypothetical protein